jgi:hypothetical protein
MSDISEKQFEKPPGPLTYIAKDINSYTVIYNSEPYTPDNTSGTEYARSYAIINCYYNQDPIAWIHFYERAKIPINSYSGSYPNYLLKLNFHISGFNDIINILRYEKPLRVELRLDSLRGSVYTSSNQPVGHQQE